MSPASQITPMQPTGGAAVSAKEESRDITFACQHCSAAFIVDVAAAGLTLNCQKCGKPTTVPNPDIEAVAENAVRISELQRHLKENESQRTEVTGYINQMSIQLHRWQLRLQSLKERQQKLESDLAEVCSRSARPIESGAPTRSAAQSSG